nr:hypothetical protein [Tanacetum cinerariifolium]
MADQRTMAELLRAPTEGYAGEIVVPPILAEHSKLKHSLINMMTSDQFFGLEKDNPNDHIRAARRWLKKEHPHSILTWEDLVSKFINEFFPPSRTTNLRNEIFNFQQLFDESFHEACDHYKDILCACPHHGFIELHQLDTFYNALNPADQDSLNSAAGGNLLERRTQDVLTIIENKSKQTSTVTTAMTAILKQFQATPPPAFVKAVEEICVTYGGAHPYYQCLVTDGKTFSEFHDNIQGYVSAAAVNYNQDSSYQAPIQQNQVVPLSELEKIKKMNEINMKAMQTQINNVKNELRNELFPNEHRFYFGFGPLARNTIVNPKGKLKAITAQSGLVLDGPYVPMPHPFINLEEDERVEETLMDQDLVEYTIKVPPPLQDKDKIQIHKFWQMFKQLHINITLADALIIIPKYQKMLKSLLSNKEKLLELENTPFNENCSACKALADLGASINLLPLSVWKKLGLPELISTRMTLELANHAICAPAGIARDVFVSVGKFTFPADFVIADYESDPRVPLILGRPFLRTARALINVHIEEMILCDDLFATNHLSGNPTFSSYTDLTSPKVKDDILDTEGDIVLIEKLLNLDSTKDLPPTHNINPLSGSITSFSPDHLLEEFVDKLALITFPLGNDDLLFDIESDLKELKYLLNHDLIKEMDSILKDSVDKDNLANHNENLVDTIPEMFTDEHTLEDSVDKDNLANHNENLVDTIPEMFTDEHTLDYSSSPLYDDFDDDLDELESNNDDAYNDPFYYKEDKIKESKLLIDEHDPFRLSDFFTFPEYDSFLFEDFSEVDALPLTNNEDTVFNPGILIHENLSEVTVQVAPDKNENKISMSNASLILEYFNPPLSDYELPFHKEVLGSETLFSFSSKTRKKIFQPRILTSKGVHTSLLPELSHRGPKAFKLIKIFESLMEIFPCSYGEDICILDVPCLHFYPL